MSDQTLQILTYVLLGVCAWLFWYLGEEPEEQS
jgi:hypothetical protein